MSQIQCTENSQCPELELQTRKFVYGDKSSTIKKWIDEIIRLRIGDTRRHQRPLNNTEVSEALGVSRQTVIDYIKLAEKHKMAETGDSGRLVVPELSKTLKQFEHFSNDSFMENSLVRDWCDNLLTKKEGKPIKTWQQRYSALKRMCNTLKIQPEQLIIDKKTYLEILKNFRIGLTNGTIKMENCNVETESKKDSAFYRCKMASRDFVQFHGISLPKGIGGVASGKVIGHAKYPDIRLTLEEINEGDKFIVENFGLDSDVMRVWGCGIDGAARKVALMKMECNWTEHISKNGIKTFFMRAYETKTESWWKKYIRRPLTQQSLILAKKRGQRLIIDESVPLGKKEKEISNQLKEVYKHLGKEDVHEGYFIRKSIHVLRHIGAQYQIKLSHGNLTWVQEACGWKSDIELKASYGELPPETVIEMIDDLAVIAN